ncbi:MAG: hypothetical protein U9P49_13435 [Thermodesulfobacteriota bacterium]|nr:hypothetical protein [Thermodesulfobacteriota bacterium]
MDDTTIKVYGYRWVVLGAFMFINVTIQFLWICFAPITGPAAELTYPAPEGTSNGLLQLAGQISVVFIYGMGVIHDTFGSFTPALILAFVLLVLNCILVTRFKESTLIEEMNRHA